MSAWLTDRHRTDRFRWAACQIDTIVHLDLIDEASIQKLLGNLPKTVFGIYERILTQNLPRDAENNCKFVRTALALICSNTSEIPNAEVLVEASLFNVARGFTHTYDFKRLEKLLGCLVKTTPIGWKPPSVFRHPDTEEANRRVAPAHYTVKEYLFHPDTAKGSAKYFALSYHATQILELEVAFNGLLQFSNRGSRNDRTRYEEYCLRMTDKALKWRRTLIARESSIWKTVLQCLRPECAHHEALRPPKIRQAFPRWDRLHGLFRADRGAKAPKNPQTAILISLLQLSWPELAGIYLRDLVPEDLENVWDDHFILASNVDGQANNGGGGTGLVRQTFLELCVSRRRIDFLDHLVQADANFTNEGRVLYAALRDPYVQGSYGQGVKGNGRIAGGDRPVTQQDDGETTYKLLKMALKQGANPNPRGYRYTPLQAAVCHLEERWVQTLLLESADPNEVGDPDGVQPYHGSGTIDEKWYQQHPLWICEDVKPPWDRDDHDFEFDEQVKQARARVGTLLMQYAAERPEKPEEPEEPEEPDEDEVMEDD